MSVGAHGQGTNVCVAPKDHWYGSTVDGGTGATGSVFMWQRWTPPCRMEIVWQGVPRVVAPPYAPSFWGQFLP